jgi:hypothetical protein
MLQAAGPCSLHPRWGVKSERSHGSTKKLNGYTTDTMKKPEMMAIPREMRYRCGRLLAGASGVLMAFLLDSQQFFRFGAKRERTTSDTKENSKDGRFALSYDWGRFGTFGQGGSSTRLRQVNGAR